MKKLKYFIYFILAVFFLSGCQDVKKGFESKKLDQGNEFLVIKKNPLELPPNFNEMPEPKGDTNSTGSNSNSKIKDNNSENSFESLVNKDKTKQNNSTEGKSSNLEENILKKIK